MKLFQADFISKEGERHLINYKYDGADYSLIYKYILSPFAQFLVDHIIPEWMAYLIYFFNLMLNKLF